VLALGNIPTHLLRFSRLFSLLNPHSVHLSSHMKSLVSFHEDRHDRSESQVSGTPSPSLLCPPRIYCPRYQKTRILAMQSLHLMIQPSMQRHHRLLVPVSRMLLKNQKGLSAQDLHRTRQSRRQLRQGHPTLDLSPSRIRDPHLHPGHKVGASLLPHQGRSLLPHDPHRRCPIRWAQMVCRGGCLFENLIIVASPTHGAQ
jgi:hypothetical protein